VSEIVCTTEAREGLPKDQIFQALEACLNGAGRKLQKVLLLPPDYSRVFSGVGSIAAECLRMLRKMGCMVDMMPALGTHEPMSKEEILEMFEGEIIPGDVIAHDWRNDIVQIGEVPDSYVKTISKGLQNTAIPVEINNRLLDPTYDLILSLGQVVPHEVAGMANYSKNILVGCGGYSMISRTHLLGAAWGIRRVLGTEDSPVRAVFDYAQAHFLADLPLVYVMTVSAPYEGESRIRGLFIGNSRELFAKAAAQSAVLNITRVKKPVHKIVAFMEGKEYKTAWVGNKAIYRTCMALENGGELIIIAPGVRRFGEDLKNDALIRRYGYHGTAHTLALMEKEPELAANTSVVAHLIHGSTDGQFTVTYATDRLSEVELQCVGYSHMPHAEAVKRYVPAKKEDGYYQTQDGEAYLFIAHPSMGLWTA